MVGDFQGRHRTLIEAPGSMGGRFTLHQPPSRRTTQASTRLQIRGDRRLHRLLRYKSGVPLLRIDPGAINGSIFVKHL